VGTIHLSAGTHRKLKLRAASDGIRLQELVNRILESGMAGDAPPSGENLIANSVNSGKIDSAYPPTEMEWHERLSLVLNSRVNSAIDAVQRNLLVFEEFVHVKKEDLGQPRLTAVPADFPKKTSKSGGITKPYKGAKAAPPKGKYRPSRAAEGHGA
jgi:plasmid stability protein